MRKKMLFVTGFLIIILFLALYVTSNVMLLSSLDRQEDQNVLDNVERAYSAFSYLLAKMDASTLDWASWNDTYAFIRENNTEYIESNIVYGSFVAIDTNFMFFVNSSGSLVLGKVFDLQSGDELPLTQALQDALSVEGPLLCRGGDGDCAAGILVLAEGPVMFTSRPILMSDGGGPARGTLVMGRYMDAGLIGKLGDITRLNVSMSTLADAVPEDTRTVHLSLGEGAPVAIRPASEQVISGYVTLNDLYGNPVLFLRVDLPRDLHAQGESTIFYFVLSVSAFILVFAILLLLFLDEWLLSRLSSLTATISKAAGKAIPSHGPDGRMDEFSKLDGSFRGVLAALEQSQKELKRHSEQLEELVNERTEALNETSKLYRGLFTMASDPILVIGIDDGRILETNRSASHVLGYTRREFRQLPVESLAPSCLGQLKGVVSRPPRSRATAFECEAWRRDGTAIHLDVTARRIDHRGSPAVLAIARDATKRKRRERYLEEVNQSKSDFLAGMSHELRTPLNAIIGYTEMLIDRHFGDINEKQKKYLGNVHDSGRHLLTLVNDMFDISKIESGELEIMKEPFDVAECVEDVHRQILPKARAYNHTLEIRIAEGLPRVVSDETRVKQVLVNLLDNAVKYTPPGGRIAVTAARDDGYVRVSVSDNGPGIPREFRGKIFEKFGRVENVRRDRSGAGLGLYLSKHLVKLLGGRIWMESKPGMGSTFHFTLPLGGEKPPHAPPA